MRLWMLIYRVPFKVTVILTYDLVSGIIVSGAYLIYYLSRDSIFGVMIPIGMAECSIQFLVTLTLTSGLISRLFVSGA